MGKIAYATFVPTFNFNKAFIENVVAVFGTTISPYLFFWQSGQEVEEVVADHKIKEMGAGRPHVSAQKISIMRWNTIIGMLVSTLIMWFIIITAAATLHAQNITEIHTADQAALALKPFAGEFSSIIFALGIIGTGLLSTPVLSGSASYALCETFQWKEGLNKKFRHAPAFYMVIIIATFIGLLTNYMDIKPFQMLYYTAIINGLMAPPLIIMIMLISNNKKIMKRRTNAIVANSFGWMLAAIMSFLVLIFMMTKR